MPKRTVPILIGNWKATPATKDEAVKFVKSLDRKITNFRSKKKLLPKKSYYLSVADIFIPHLNEVIKNGYVGAQTITGIALGQTTGTVIPSQLASGGATFTLVGHSEVRAAGESADARAHKVALSLQSKLMTVLCVGEQTRDKDGTYLALLEEDVKESLSLAQKNLFEHLVIAYEPLWAIGAANPATPQECFEAVIALRRALASLVGIEYAKKVHVLYGGSVTKDTARSFIEEGGVDGLLVGRASQSVDEWFDILISCYTL